MDRTRKRKEREGTEKREKGKENEEVPL